MFADKIYSNMKIDVLEAILASAYMYSVGYSLFFVNKKVITCVFDTVFGYFQRQGVKAERRRRRIEEEIRRMEEEENEDENEEAKLVPPPVQVIDDVGKKKCH